MAKFKPYDYNQMVMLPVCLSEQIIPNTLEHTIHTLIENRIDMSVFDSRYNNDDTGCYAYNPKVLLKVVLLGYSRSLLSSRKLERACRENILFMALSCAKPQTIQLSLALSLRWNKKSCRSFKISFWSVMSRDFWAGPASPLMVLSYHRMLQKL